MDLMEMSEKKKCPICNDKLEEYSGGGLEAEEWDEDPGYICKNKHWLSTEDYNKL